ncbi:hypothetical protein KSP39_PZI003750 [Platanthera zijinensis]|uniref:N-acetyltransferase domain-containing protein n=1 Tax=Platanthera zijinensis TaxID=2320716 RepID=A0AAP0BUG6_9ASPA
MSQRRREARSRLGIKGRARRREQGGEKHPSSPSRRAEAEDQLRFIGSTLHCARTSAPAIAIDRSIHQLHQSFILLHRPGRYLQFFIQLRLWFRQIFQQSHPPLVAGKKHDSISILVHRVLSPFLQRSYYTSHTLLLNSEQWSSSKSSSFLSSPAVPLASDLPLFVVRAIFHEKTHSCSHVICCWNPPWILYNPCIAWKKLYGEHCRKDSNGEDCSSRGRGRGIGSQLLKACEELVCQMKAAQKVYLHCRVTDTGPLKMYKKANYTIDKTDSVLVWLTLQRRKHLMVKELLVNNDSPLNNEAGTAAVGDCVAQ